MKQFKRILLVIALALGVFASQEQFASAAEQTDYVIQQGDTLSKIAKKFNLSVAELKEFNDLKDDKIKAGQTLLTQPKKKISKASVYVIQQGDTLSSIAKTFNTTVVELKKLNGLKDDKIKAGKELKVPSFEVVSFQALIIGSSDSNTLEVKVGKETIVVNTTFALTIDEKNRGKSMFFVLKNEKERPLLLEMLPVIE